MWSNELILSFISPKSFRSKFCSIGASLSFIALFTGEARFGEGEAFRRPREFDLLAELDLGIWCRLLEQNQKSYRDNFIAYKVTPKDKKVLDPVESDEELLGNSSEDFQDISSI